MVYTISGLARRSEKQYPLLSGQSFLRAVFQRGKQCRSNSVSVAAVWQHLSQNALDLLGAKQKVNLSGLSMATTPDFTTQLNNVGEHRFGIWTAYATPEVEPIMSSTKVDTCTVLSWNKYLDARFFQMKLFTIVMATSGTTTRQIF
jgi:hypothetical protein